MEVTGGEGEGQKEDGEDVMTVKVDGQQSVGSKLVEILEVPQNLPPPLVQVSEGADTTKEAKEDQEEEGKETSSLHKCRGVRISLKEISILAHITYLKFCLRSRCEKKLKFNTT